MSVESSTPQPPEPYVWVTPARMGGEPCVGGSRVPARQIAHAVWEGHGRDYIAVEEGGNGGWVFTEREVLMACWYDTVYGRGRNAPWRKAWKAWADGPAYDALCRRGHYAPWPPAREEQQ